jgi:hypothetical protein
MSPKCNNPELLHSKDSYNRISLKNAWTNAHKKISALKFVILKQDYGDLRSDISNEQRRLMSEGLKI